MVLRKVIGIRNVNLLRKKQGEPEEKTRREKAPINNKISRREKQGRGYNPAKIVGSKCSHYRTTLVLG